MTDKLSGLRRSHLRSVVAEHKRVLLEANPSASDEWKRYVQAFAELLLAEIEQTAPDALDDFDVPGRNWPKPS